MVKYSWMMRIRMQDLPTILSMCRIWLFHYFCGGFSARMSLYRGSKCPGAICPTSSTPLPAHGCRVISHGMILYMMTIYGIISRGIVSCGILFYGIYSFETLLRRLPWERLLVTSFAQRFCTSPRKRRHPRPDTGSQQHALGS